MRVHIRVHFCLGVKKDNVLPLQEDCTDVSAGRGTQDNSATLEVLILVHNPSKRHPFYSMLSNLLLRIIFMYKHSNKTVIFIILINLKSVKYR